MLVDTAPELVVVHVRSEVAGPGNRPGPEGGEVGGVGVVGERTRHHLSAPAELGGGAAAHRAAVGVVDVGDRVADRPAWQLRADLVGTEAHSLLAS